jgi:hypothetical protein
MESGLLDLHKKSVWEQLGARNGNPTDFQLESQLFEPRLLNLVKDPIPSDRLVQEDLTLLKDSSSFPFSSPQRRGSGAGIGDFDESQNSKQ